MAAKARRGGSNGWGGARPGAGRKPGPTPMTPHRARPRYRASTPVLVTLRSHLTTLDTPRVCSAIERAVRGSAARDPKHFQVLHSAAEREHLYLVVKASDARALSLGMRSVTIRVARTVNDLLGRSGSLW